jgi:hypothetical protein
MHETINEPTAWPRQKNPFEDAIKKPDAKDNADWVKKVMPPGTAIETNVALAVPPNIKFAEDKYLKEVWDYVFATYGQHYNNHGETKPGKNIQSLEAIISAGNGDGFIMGNIQKLSGRYGKKKGFNRLELLKIAHYAVLMLYVHDLEERGSSKG